MQARHAAAFALALALAGCFAAPAPDDGGPGMDLFSCVHPHPCGDEWPLAADARFDLDRILSLHILSHDGTPLEAHVFLPGLPQGVRAPVLLWSTPYPGSCPFNTLFACIPRGDDPDHTTRISPLAFVEDGYAVAVVNVRGTGTSGGCFDMGGPREQRDQAHLVDWLARQPWGNGRVGMLGHSYPFYTSWMAAIQDAEHLSFLQGGGHGGSHPHLAHNFLMACLGQQPPMPDAETSVNWTMVGICAHESALKGGEKIRIPRF